MVSQHGAAEQGRGDLDAFSRMYLPTEPPDSLFKNRWSGANCSLDFGVGALLLLLTSEWEICWRVALEWEIFHALEEAPAEG